MFHVYMIECADGSLYTGVARDITRRLREHYYRLPRCARYTRSHPMTGLRGLWETKDKVTAYRLEYRIKQLDRKAKDGLLANPEPCTGFLTCRRRPSGGWRLRDRQTSSPG